MDFGKIFKDGVEALSDFWHKFNVSFQILPADTDEEAKAIAENQEPAGADTDNVVHEEMVAGLPLNQQKVIDLIDGRRMVSFTRYRVC